jgi:hypothetical protein
MQDLHPEARRRFDELGDDLLGGIVTFREPGPRPKPAFVPDLFQSHTVTDDNVIGDVILGYAAHDGKSTGKVVAREQGLRVGFVGPGYAKLESLAKAMRKTEPFASMAGLAFLIDHLFAWGLYRHDNRGTTGVVDFVMAALRAAATELDVIVPISDLHVQSELKLGDVAISAFPKSFFEQFEMRQVADPSEATAHQEWCRKVRADFQGRAVARVRVYAEPVRARELAVDRVDVAVGVLRFFAPAHFDSRIVSRIDSWGYAPQRTDTIFLADQSGRCTNISESLIDPPGPMTLDDEAVSFLLGAGLAELREIVSKVSRSDLEEAILSGVLLFGRGALTPDLRQRLVWYCAALESVLLKNTTESITQNLAERLAIGAYATLTERKQAISDVRAAYDLRSRFMHHGLDVEDGEVVVRFAKHGLRLFLQLAKNAARFQTKAQFFEHVETVKLS